MALAARYFRPMDPALYVDFARSEWNLGNCRISCHAAAKDPKGQTTDGVDATLTSSWS
jgi:hypothetical protein